MGNYYCLWVFGSVCMYIILCSPVTHTVLYWYHLINRCRPVQVAFSGPELVAPDPKSALDEQL